MKTINVTDGLSASLATSPFRDLFIEGPINLNEKLFIGIDFKYMGKIFTGFMNNLPIDIFEDPCNVYFTNTISDYGIAFDPTLEFGSLQIKLVKDPNDPFFLIVPCITIEKSNPTVFLPTFSTGIPEFRFGSIISDSIQDAPQMYAQFITTDGLLQITDELISGVPYKINFFTKSDDGNFLPLLNRGISILLPDINVTNECDSPVVPNKFKTENGQIPNGSSSEFSSDVLYVDSGNVFFRVYQVFNYSKDTNGICKRNTKLTDVIFKKNFYNKLLGDTNILFRITDNIEKSNLIRLDSNILSSFDENDIEKIQMILDTVNEFTVEKTEMFSNQLENKITELNNFFTKNINNMKTINNQISKMVQNMRLLNNDIDLVDLFLDIFNISSEKILLKTDNVKLKRQILINIGFSVNDVESGIFDNVILDGVIENYIDGIERIKIVNEQLEKFLDICINNLSALERLTRRNKIFTLDNCDISLKILGIKEKLTAYRDLIFDTQFNISENSNITFFEKNIDVSIILTFSTLELCINCN